MVASKLTKAERATRTRVDTIVITPDSVRAWKDPPFQRPLRENEKVRACAEHIKRDGGVLPGVITIGTMLHQTYLLDGQHRRLAFLISGLPEGFVDVRYQDFDDMAEMGEAWVELNSQLVRLRPDDILRGLEGTSDALRLLRRRCPFVGYDMIRRGPKAPIVGMSAILRCWAASAADTPSTSMGVSAAQMARTLTEEETGRLADFLLLADRAWGRDHEYARLWSGLNVTLCMWLYRRAVLAEDPSVSRASQVSPAAFGHALMSLSADAGYIDWLLGRKLSDHDRSPAYARIKATMARRLTADGGKRASLPQPAWSTHYGGGRAPGGTRGRASVTP